MIGSEVEERGQHRGDLAIRLTYSAPAVGIHIDAYRICLTDGVGDLDLDLIAHTGGNQVLGEITSSIGSGAIHLTRILTAEGTTTMSSPAAIGIYDDLTSGQTGIPGWTTEDKAPGRIEQIPDLIIEEVLDLRAVLLDQPRDHNTSDIL